MEKIKEECSSCSGTGLYRGMCEGPGKAVVCINCEGKGWVIHQYRPFTGRHRKNGITQINYSRGSFIGTGVGAVGTTMTYKEFEEKIKP